MRAARGPSALVLGLAALVVVSGCAGSSSTPAPPSPSPSSTPSASPTPVAPADALAALAALGVQASYTADYTLAGKGSTAPSTVRMRHTPTSYRLDVTSAGATAVLIGTPRGTYSCRVSKASRVCFAVAGPGKPVPALFDAGLQRIFTDYLAILAHRAGTFTVAAAAGVPGTGSLPTGTCFSVRRNASTPKPWVAAGTYCLSATGVPTSATLASGSLTLTRLRGAPVAQTFSPPASPTPLPRS